MAPPQLRRARTDDGESADCEPMEAACAPASERPILKATTGLPARNAASATSRVVGP